MRSAVAASSSSHSSIEYAGDEYYATPEHYLFGLYSRLVQAGAARIASNYGDPASVTNVAFANPDGTIVAIVANQTDTPQQLVLRSEGNQIRATLDGKTAAAYVWRAGLGPSALAPDCAPPERTRCAPPL